jgi:hypothetical protein
VGDAESNALPKKKRDARPDKEHKYWVPVQSILQTAQLRAVAILVDCHDPDVPVAAVAEIATTGMMP